MGLVQTHALGRNRKFFSVPETTAGTPVVPAATDAAKVLKSSMALEQARDGRMDSRSTRSVLERITGKAKVSWNIESYVVPSGTAGTPPDLHPLLYAALGTYANSSSTSDTYTPSDSQTLRTVSLYHEYNSVMSELVYGAWVEEMKIAASGGDSPKLTLSGGAMGYVPTGTSTQNGADASNSLTVQTADARAFNKYSLVKVGSDSNSSAGWQLTVDTSRPAFTVVGSPAGGGTGVAVIPFLPSETVAGVPINGIDGSITLGGTTFIVTSFEVSVKNNVKPFEDEAFSQYVTDVVAAFRDVKGQVAFRARKDFITTFAKRSALTTYAISVTLGTGAGKRCVISVPYAESDFSAVDFPETDEAIITIPFTALGSSGADEISVVFQ